MNFLQGQSLDYRFERLHRKGNFDRKGLRLLYDNLVSRATNGFEAELEFLEFLNFLGVKKVEFPVSPSEGVRVADFSIRPSVDPKEYTVELKSVGNSKQWKTTERKLSRTIHEGIEQLHSTKGAQNKWLVVRINFDMMSSGLETYQESELAIVTSLFVDHVRDCVRPHVEREKPELEGLTLLKSDGYEQTVLFSGRWNGTEWVSDFLGMGPLK